MNDKIIISAFSDEYAVSFDEQLAAMKRLGISHIELRIVNGKGVADLTDADFKYVKEKLCEYGISVSAIGSPIGKIRLDGDIEGHMLAAERLVSLARELGTDKMRIFSFYAPEGRDITEFKSEVISLLERLISIADKHGVTLCHENEAKIYGDTPERCLELLEHFGGRLGCVFDMGNFALDGIDSLRAYAMLRPYVKYFHVKDSLSAGAIVPPGCGEAHIKEILDLHSAKSDAPFFITLEPHLQTFDGLHALTDRGFDNPYKFESAAVAFETALTRLKEIIE